jgi:hypothetical protein
MIFLSPSSGPTTENKLLEIQELRNKIIVNNT